MTLTTLCLQELEPWTSTTAPAVLHDIGPLAVEADHGYQQLLHLLTALHQTQHAHDKLLSLRTQNACNSQGLSSLLDDVTAKHKALKLQQQLLSTVQQRLIGSSHNDSPSLQTCSLKVL